MSLSETYDAALSENPFEMFEHPPKQPFSYRFEMEADAVLNVLQRMVVYAAARLYGCELGQLKEDQVKLIRQYLLSICWDGAFVPLTETKRIVMYSKYGQPVLDNFNYRRVNVTFHPADPGMNQWNAPARLF